MDDEANKRIAAERKAQKYRARVYESFPVRNWDKWVEDTQGHLFIQSLEPNAKARDLFAGTKLIAERGFAGRIADAGEEFDAVWTPYFMPELFMLYARQFKIYARTDIDALIAGASMFLYGLAE